MLKVHTILIFISTIVLSNCDCQQIFYCRKQPWKCIIEIPHCACDGNLYGCNIFSKNCEGCSRPNKYFYDWCRNNDGYKEYTFGPNWELKCEEKIHGKWRPNCEKFKLQKINV
jgi:hypothetical protein